MKDFFEQVKADRNVYLDTWADFVQLVGVMEKEAAAAARDFSTREEGENVTDPRAFAKAMGEVQKVLGETKKKLEGIGRSNAGKVFFPG